MNQSACISIQADRLPHPEPYHLQQLGRCTLQEWPGPRPTPRNCACPTAKAGLQTRPSLAAGAWPVHNQSGLQQPHSTSSSKTVSLHWVAGQQATASNDNTQYPGPRPGNPNKHPARTNPTSSGRQFRSCRSCRCLLDTALHTPHLPGSQDMRWRSHTQPVQLCCWATGVLAGAIAPDARVATPVQCNCVQTYSHELMQALHVPAALLPVCLYMQPGTGSTSLTRPLHSTGSRQGPTPAAAQTGQYRQQPPCSKQAVADDYEASHK